MKLKFVFIFNPVNFAIKGNFFVNVNSAWNLKWPKLATLINAAMKRKENAVLAEMPIDTFLLLLLVLMNNLVYF